MQDLFGYEIADKDSSALLDDYVQQGFLFLNIKQIRKILGKSYDQIRYAIINYELDAFIICGEYRVTIQALRDYIAGCQEEFERDYHNLMIRRELDGVYDLAFRGKTEQIWKSINSHGYPVTSIDELACKQQLFHYEGMPAGETVIEDFYDIPSLHIPDDISVGYFSSILQVVPDRLANELDRQIYDPISYPEVFDFLVEREYLNFNIPVPKAVSQNIIRDDGQLYLF